MSELIWYVYHQQQQLGPFEGEQVKQLYLTKMISQDSYIFKIGWKDWQPIEDAFAELGIEKSPNTDLNTNKKRRIGAPRATIGGRVILHNNGQLIIGAGVNISATGIFIETQDQIFNVGEVLKLTIKANGLSKQFNSQAQVIRANDHNEKNKGYGLKFIDLDPLISDEIQRLVNMQNANKKEEYDKAN